MLSGLAKRHVDYGVRDEHYGKVGEAPMWTLEKGLGNGFTGEVRAAWAALYGTVATMKEAAAGVRASA
jgi:nitric oxide dioxygenase